MAPTVSIFWFRRDLRLADNAGLYHALRGHHPVLPVFIFDRNILNELSEKKDKRVHFIHDALAELKKELELLGSTLYVLYETPIEAFRKLIHEYPVDAVFTNNDYEPYARDRDFNVARLLGGTGIALYSYKDQVVFEKNEVLKDNNEPYTVFTPYSRKWKEKLNDFLLTAYPFEKYRSNFLKCEARHLPSLAEIGFEPAPPTVVLPVLDERIAANYDQTRDIPSIEGTTRLSVHLRFGTVSVRQLAKAAGRLNGTFLNELIWREFYQMILWHFPHVVNTSFKKDYDNIQWRNNEQEFEQWCQGKTGYPIVDAGMRQLNETGYMHNRVRMVVASFLTKHLLIDWRWGEAYFAEKLLDYDLAANNGGWQWAAGSGCDAAPYFRIFNPYLQTQKFDPLLKYIRQWIPEYDELSYIPPIVEHPVARARCLEVYKKALNDK